MDQSFRRASVGVTDMEFRRLFDQNILRHFPLAGASGSTTKIPRTGAEAAAAALAADTAASEAVVAASVPPPEGSAYASSAYDPAGLIRAVGSTVTIANDAEKSHGSIAYYKIKEIRITQNSLGGLTVFWQHKSITGDGINSQLWINGVAYGVEKSTSDPAYVEVSSEYPDDLVIGDLIQIYVKRVVPLLDTAYVKNMRLRYSWTITNVGDHVLVNSLPVTDATIIGTVDQDP